MDPRTRRLVMVLGEEGLDAALIFSEADQRWLEGFTGSECCLAASAGGNFLFADSRYVELAQHDCRTARVIERTQSDASLADLIAETARASNWHRIGFEPDEITYGQYTKFAAALEAAGAVLVPLPDHYASMRAIKDEHEIATIGRCGAIADQALAEIIPILQPGITELEVKTELEHRMMRGGADGVSFDTIVLFGARTSQPHAVSRRDVVLVEGDLILIDFGAALDGYRSDMTRTFVCRQSTEKQRAAYRAVLAAQLESLAMVAPGVQSSELYERAISELEAADLPPFSHGLGHGVGLEIHERPAIRKDPSIDLQPGMVITIEPGTYIPGWGGIRIEDTVAVTGDAYQLLTHFPKDHWVVAQNTKKYYF